MTEHHPSSVASLQEQETKHRRVLAALPDMLFIYNRQGIQVDFIPSRDWNPIVPPEEFLHKSVTDVLPAEIAAQILAGIHRTLETNDLQIIEYQLEINGILCDYEARLVPTGTDEVTAIVRDITFNKQALATLQQQTTELEHMLRELRHTQAQMIQAEKMSSLGQLVAGVAHEINNPVNFIYGNLSHANGYAQDLLSLLALYQRHYPTPVPEIEEQAEAIDLDFLVEDLPRLLSSMKVGAERIQTIVTSLRTFSRMDESERKAVNIHDGIDSTLMILQSRLKPRHDHPGIQVIKDYGALPLVECYAGQLNQVFMNILSNAIDALDEPLALCPSLLTVDNAPQKIPTIRICTELVASQIPAIERNTQHNTHVASDNKQSASNAKRTPTNTPTNHVRIRIADNGTGIPAHIHKRLFDPFFTTKPVGKGTGMGLSISYQIVTEKHGGSLRCISELGQGTEFIIEIPV